MKSLILTLVLIITYALVAAQTTVKGRIVDNGNEPIPGANILIQDSYAGTSSAADGSFQFKTDENGTAPSSSNLSDTQSIAKALVLREIQFS